MPVKIENIASFQADDAWTVIVLIAHLGDIIACEPVIRYARKEWPGKKIAWVLLKQYSEIVSFHPDLDCIIETASLQEATEWSEKIRDKCRIINLHFHRRKCPVTKRYIFNTNTPEIDEDTYFDHGSILEAFTSAAGLPALKDAPKYYCDPDVELPDLPERYVVFHAKSNNDDLKDWRREEWLKLYDFFAAQKMYVVEIGLTPVLAIDAFFYRDLTSVYTLTQVAGIIQKADFFIGIDSAFAHLANALLVNGLVIAGVYGNWKKYIPYTGLYRSGRMVAPACLPARYVTAEMVLSRYQQLRDSSAGDPPAAGPEDVPIRLECNFPNTIQRAIVAKVYRPFVKRFAKEHYSLFLKYPALYFLLAPESDPVHGIFRQILALFGDVPAKIR